jgi:hypothetical protein
MIFQKIVMMDGMKPSAEGRNMKAATAKLTPTTARNTATRITEIGLSHFTRLLSQLHYFAFSVSRPRFPAFAQGASISEKCPTGVLPPSETIGRQIVGSCATRRYYARVGVAGPSPAPLRGFALKIHMMACIPRELSRTLSHQLDVSSARALGPIHGHVRTNFSQPACR